jgi:hypothetical protein
MVSWLFLFLSVVRRQLVGDPASSAVIDILEDLLEHAGNKLLNT